MASARDAVRHLEAALGLPDRKGAAGRRPAKRAERARALEEIAAVARGANKQDLLRAEGAVAAVVSALFDGAVRGKAAFALLALVDGNARNQEAAAVANAVEGLVRCLQSPGAETRRHAVAGLHALLAMNVANQNGARLLRLPEYSETIGRGRPAPGATVLRVHTAVGLLMPLIDNCRCRNDTGAVCHDQPCAVLRWLGVSHDDERRLQKTATRPDERSPAQGMPMGSSDLAKRRTAGRMRGLELELAAAQREPQSDASPLRSAVESGHDTHLKAGQDEAARRILAALGHARRPGTRAEQLQKLLAFLEGGQGGVADARKQSAAASEGAFALVLPLLDHATAGCDAAVRELAAEAVHRLVWQNTHNQRVARKGGAVKLLRPLMDARAPEQTLGYSAAAAHRQLGIEGSPSRRGDGKKLPSSGLVQRLEFEGQDHVAIDDAFNSQLGNLGTPQQLSGWSSGAQEEHDAGPSNGNHMQTLRSRIHAAAYDVGGENLQLLTRQFDKNNDGQISWAEFQRGVRGICKISHTSLSDDQIAEAFDAIDGERKSSAMLLLLLVLLLLLLLLVLTSLPPSLHPVDADNLLTIDEISEWLRAEDSAVHERQQRQREEQEQLPTAGVDALDAASTTPADSGNGNVALDAPATGEMSEAESWLERSNLLLADL